MATYDFSTPEDEPVIFKFGKGADKVEVDLTFVSPERAFDFVMFVKDTREKVKGRGTYTGRGHGRGYCGCFERRNNPAQY